MRFVRARVCAFAILSCCSAYAESRGQDEGAIRKVIAEMVQSWNRHDMKAFAQLCAEDADYVDIGAINEKGRAEIERHHTEIHAGPYKDSTLTAVQVDVRFLRPDVAVAHVLWEVEYNQGKDKKTAFQTLVLTQQSRKWLIAAAHNGLRSRTPATGAATK